MKTSIFFLSSALALLLASPRSEAAPTSGYNVVPTADQNGSGCQCPVVLPGPSAAHCGGTTFHQFVAILEHFLREDCDVADPCGQITPVASPDTEYDFIVVGGGSAGSVVASRLSEVAEWKVLLIEAGVNEPAGSQVPSFYGDYINSTIDWQYLTEPQDMACLGNEDRRCAWPRGKVIGGTGVLHGMMYMRGNRRDYDKWAAEGNTGWSYADVLPYFLKSEDNLQINEVDAGYHAVGGLLPVSHFPHHPAIAQDFLAGAEELGQRVGDLNGEQQQGFTIAQANSRNGVRYSSARAFLRPAQHRPNLHILLNTTVLRVLISEDKQAYGVEVLRSDGQLTQILSKKEVIVSGGAVNSPKILLLSGVGDREQLEQVNVSVVHDLPGVGRNLHNHVSFELQFYVNESDRVDLNWASAMEYMLKKGGPMTSTGLAQLTGFYKTKFVNASEDDSDIQFYFGGYLANCAQTGDIGELSGSAATRKIISIYPTAIHAASTGYLTLADNDPITHPRIFANYLSNYTDVETLVEGIKFALNLTGTEALAAYNLELVKTPVAGCESQTFGSDEYWECAIRHHTGPENHQAGSCKMGPATDSAAVVDAELRVHGLSGLRVVDASVMPRVTSGNLNAPVVMVAEKGADMIRQQWSNNGSLTSSTSPTSTS